MSDPTVEVRIVVDNAAGEGLRAEHGLAILIREAGRSYLLDTGQGGALSQNAATLGIDLGSIDALILSHGHYDHTGGIPTVVQRRPEVEIYFHPSVFLPRFSVDERGARQIGMPPESARAMQHVDERRLHVVRGTERLGARVGMASPIERATDFEDAGGPFFFDSAATRPDPIDDDLAVWVRTEEGLVVVVGCCHAGIINTLQQVIREAGETRVRAVIGGLHLLHASRVRLDATVSALEAISPRMIVPCHCTGDGAVAALGRAFGERVQVGSSGDLLRF